MVYRGGIDKRAIVGGIKAIEEEIRRVAPPLLEEGGFIPSCDHDVPSDISWPNFIEYARIDKVHRLVKDDRLSRDADWRSR